MKKFITCTSINGVTLNKPIKNEHLDTWYRIRKISGKSSFPKMISIYYALLRLTSGSEYSLQGDWNLHTKQWGRGNMYSDIHTHKLRENYWWGRQGMLEEMEDYWLLERRTWGTSKRRGAPNIAPLLNCHCRQSSGGCTKFRPRTRNGYFTCFAFQVSFDPVEFYIGFKWFFHSRGHQKSLRKAGF